MRARTLVVAGAVAALLGGDPASATCPATPASDAPVSGAPVSDASSDPSRPAPVPARPGNPSGDGVVPDDGAAVDTSSPTRVIGNGTPQSCTSSAVVAAVAAGGIIRFSCGPAPITIRMRGTAKVLNTTRLVVIDGGGLVTLSGNGRRRIL
jgi:hypothetical protein